MWIVRLALRRPYTFVVMALMLLLSGIWVVRQTPTDVLPDVDIPVISVVWTYTGLPAQQIEQQVTLFSEQSLAGNVADIQSIQSDSFDGVSVIRLFLQPDADVASAMAQATAASQTIVRRMPPGIVPPIILRYTASSVPILQLAFSSDTLSEAEIYDHVNQRVRTMLSVVRGTRFPLPAGGKQRQITVDLDPAALRAHGVSPAEVSQTIAAQNLTLPTGAAKIAEREYRISLNSSPEAIAALNEIPLTGAAGRQLFVRDVAHVHDGYAIQTNIARRDGRRSVVLSVMKTGDASTTEVADRVKALVPVIRAAAPEGLEVELLSDQSTFVTRAIDGLLVEGVIAMVLTAAMILLFLGSVRATVLVAINIPLAVIIALLCLRALGATINVMTLGGLALAVGILVDDATVEIENIHRNLAMGKGLTRAILDGAQQIAVPAFVASLCISIVFVSVVFLEGPARFIFLPMGMAVAFAVMGSYLLSRTLVPTLARYLLAEHHTAAPSRGLFARIHRGFEAGFERVRARYVGLLAWALARPRTVATLFAMVVAATVALAPFVGRDFFPQVDAGQVRLHVTAPPGTRIEETERWFSRVEDRIRELVPADQRESILDFIGMPSGYTLAITDSSNVGSSDGEILLTLAHDRELATADIVRALREQLPREFPELSFYFQPADIVTQILNFGLPSPIDVQVSGAQRDATLKAARSLEAELRAVPGVVDVHLHQIVAAPRLHVEVDRQRAHEAGLSERDVAANLLLMVSSSTQVSPTFWTDPKSSFAYPVAIQVPEHRVDSLAALQGLSLPTAAGEQKLLMDVADFRRATTPVFVSHMNVQPTYNVRADVQDSDLGSAVAQIEAIVQKHREALPPGATIAVRGQAESMQVGFARLGVGLGFAALLVYALMVINFQSWKLPFIILMALPGAAVGIVFTLFATGTTFSIPSLMGAVMSIGVATANSILVVSFANELRPQGMSAAEAALTAGSVRLRPVLMTAAAMFIGMLPMSLGLGEGGEQNAALGRAVMGGLAGATLATLGFVPVVYSVLARRWHPPAVDPDLALPGDAHAKESV
ncbi:efflux RND transporter permease subunit [Nannocystis punicea]|uniref:Efflux RND transporter permease subunit n=1 Tax=Nannocystis punicea TaxID=2995304 RepID=A0ABY7HCV4_9BACT|nr:efflux RND transporter permease subunit [Nannocystis poenicansa]WAS96920.1 efflux RND transporter permease subunit [Nannocystis poenicansa]